MTQYLLKKRLLLFSPCSYGFIKPIIFILFFIGVYNNKVIGQFHYTCATHEIHEKLLIENKEYKYQYDRINNEIYQVLKHQIELNDKSRSALINYVVPVAIHIITPPGTPIGSENNITDSQVEAGLQLLNDAFANNGDFKTPEGIDIGISFCLAKRDPNGQPTNGITRNESTLVADITPCTPFGTDMNNGGAIKAIVNWDCKEYVNIWLVTDLYNSTFGCSLAGFATFPGAGCGFDGVVQESRYWITKGGTTVSAHELGHYFSLNHTFNGGCSNGDCLLDGDQVCDTPPDNSPSFAACNTNSCNTDSPDLQDDNTNYMDYTSCTPPHFTQGQKDRMIAGLEKGRPELINSEGCLSVVNNDVAILDLKVIGGGCGSSVCPKIIFKNTGINTISSLNIIIKIDGITLLTYPWTGSLLSNTKDTLLLPCVNSTIGTHSVSIELKDPNGITDGFINNNIISINGLNIYPKPDLK
ncbi:MAG TPA: M43 family zinc metalloprotease, partial [Saprospiraceae bacterium]|nr:M43 family zinc metalloprotease [Saprospiraceae bacterium]